MPPRDRELQLVHAMIAQQNLRTGVARTAANAARVVADEALIVAEDAVPVADYTAADVLAKLLTVDGPGSGLDADTLDGQNAGTYGLSFLGTATLGDAKTLLALVKGDVGLGNVDNTADAAKNVLTATKLLTSRTIAMSGDVVWSVSFDGSGNVTATGTIQVGAVTLAKMADVATARFFGRIAAGTGVPQVLTGTQATTLLDLFTSSLQGLAPASGGGTANYLRADGTWVAPPGATSGTVTSVSVVTANGVGGTVVNASTTPAISLILYSITPTDIDSAGIVKAHNTSSANFRAVGNTPLIEFYNSTETTRYGYLFFSGSAFQIDAEDAGAVIQFRTQGVVRGTISSTGLVLPGTIAAFNFSGTSSGTNTGDQSSIVGITGTKAQFDTAVTDGNFLYVGDVTQYTDELAQDAIGAMVDASLVYVDATPLLTRAALTGDVTAAQGSNATTVVKINGVSLASLATGILKNTTSTGAPSIAVAGDFPTLNQNTSGSAATLTNPRAIYGNNFDGSAALTQIIASTYGGTGNGFAKFTGPTTSEKTFTLPNSNETLLYSGGAGGTPSSLTLTNATGLPAAGLVTSTSQAVGFGSVELGHASDTTLARASAGDVNIEGNIIYRAGGTDVPVADGGTGASTAAGARTNLGLVISTNIQAYDADLTTLGAGGSGARDFLALGTGDSPQFAGLSIIGAASTPDATLSNYDVVVRSNSTAAINVGPSIAFAGESGNGVTPYLFAGIHGAKGSSTAGDYSGYGRGLASNAAGTIIEAFRWGPVVVAASVPVKLPSSTVAGLPAAAAVGAGATAYVTDALAPTFLATVVGGGAIGTTVYSDGTNWKAG